MLEALTTQGLAQLDHATKDELVVRKCLADAPSDFFIRLASDGSGSLCPMPRRWVAVIDYCRLNGRMSVQTLKKGLMVDFEFSKPAPYMRQR